MRKYLSGAVVLVGVALCVAPAWGGVRYSEFGGIQQIWVTADAFTNRSASDGTPDYFADPKANGPLSGSAYYFGKDVQTGSNWSHSGGQQENWWVQYEIPRSALPANFNLTGDWGIWIRGQIADAAEYNGSPGGNPDMFWDSDYLFMNGHPYDLSKSNPTEADWAGALATRSNIDDRVLQNFIWVDPDYVGGVRPNWTWLNTEQPDDRSFMFKTFNLVDDKITFRLYEREAGVYNGRIDVICFARTGQLGDPTEGYMPTDADFLASAPEPTSLLLLLSGALFLKRRR
jgi:hypothetical protein